MADEAYSRVYHRIQDEYPDVFDDAQALGTWLRLLILAEGMWPSHAILPRKVHAKSLATLTEHGLVTLLAHDRYEVKGLEAERERRSSRGKAGASARWTHSERNANALPTHSDRIARRDEYETSTRLDKNETSASIRRSGSLEPVGSILEQTAARMRIQREASNDR